MIYHRGAPSADAIFLRIADICPVKEGFTAVVNLGGVVKTLRRSNSLSRTVFSTAGCFGWLSWTFFGWLAVVRFRKLKKAVAVRNSLLEKLASGAR